MNRKIHFAIFNSDLNKRFSYWAETLKAGKVFAVHSSLANAIGSHIEKSQNPHGLVYTGQLFFSLHYIILHCSKDWRFLVVVTERLSFR